jgi:hypothetical protein
MNVRRPDASAAGRALAEKRWGHSRVETLVSELRERRDQLRTEQLEQLRELLDQPRGDAA